MFEHIFFACETSTSARIRPPVSNICLTQLVCHNTRCKAFHIAIFFAISSSARSRQRRSCGNLLDLKLPSLRLRLTLSLRRLESEAHCPLPVATSVIRSASGAPHCRRKILNSHLTVVTT